MNRVKNIFNIFNKYFNKDNYKQKTSRNDVRMNKFRVENLESRCLLSNHLMIELPSSSIDWSTYLGGLKEDWVRDVAVDNKENIYVIGDSESSSWTGNNFNNKFGGMRDVFLTKLNSRGEHLWSTFLGGDGEDFGDGIAVDFFGNLYITGSTSSQNWVFGGFDSIYNGGRDDIFVAKISPAGKHLWSTYVGGNGSEYGSDIVIDDSGNSYVTGRTESAGWTSRGFDTSHNGDYDAFVTKIDTTGKNIWSTYVGGNKYDSAKGIALDSHKNIYLTGSTESEGWISNGFDQEFAGYNEAFIIKISPNGEHILSTYFGGSDWEEGNQIITDSYDNAIITGKSTSPNLVSGGFDVDYNNHVDSFVAKFSSGGEHIWSTYIGGDWTTIARGIAIDGENNTFITGLAPTGISMNPNSNGEDIFALKINSSGEYLWHTYLGKGDKSPGDHATNTIVSPLGSVIIVGSVPTEGWISGGFDTTHDGDMDGFIVKINGIASPYETKQSFKTPTIIVPGILGSMPEGYFKVRDLTRVTRRVSVENNKITIQSYRPEELTAEKLKGTYDRIIEDFISQGYLFCDLDNPNITNDSVNCDNADLFFAAYDWRQPVLLNPNNPQEILWDDNQNTFQSGVEYLDWWIDLAKQKWLIRGNSENDFSVNIIAHSMGGLVARAYIEEADEAGHNAEKVEHLVMLGTPNHGSVSSYQFVEPINQKFTSGKINYIDSIFNNYLRLAIRGSVLNVERTYRLPRGSVKSEDLLASLNDLLPTFPFVGIGNNPLIIPKTNNLLTRLNNTIADLTNATDVLLIGGDNIATPIKAKLKGAVLNFETAIGGDGVVLYDLLPGTETPAGLLISNIESIKVSGVRHNNLPNDQTVISKIFDEIFI